jgi:hypothetical protein
MTQPLFRQRPSWLGQTTLEQRVNGAWKPLNFRFVQRKSKGGVYNVRVLHTENEPPSDYFAQLDKGVNPWNM